MPQRLNSYFAASYELREFTHKTQELAALQRQYRQLAPQTLANASQVIGFERHILTVGANNSAVAAKLRQFAPNLVDLFQGSGAKVTGIQVKVQVSNPSPMRKPRGYSISVAGKQHVAELAAALPDSPLRNALQRLVSKH